MTPDSSHPLFLICMECCKGASSNTSSVLNVGGNAFHPLLLASGFQAWDQPGKKFHSTPNQHQLKAIENCNFFK